MSKSVFTLTFILEIVDVEVWHDCDEGWLDLGPCIQGIKLQYTLYLGFSFDVDILVWPHVAKIWCGNRCGWVRTWQFLQRRWIAFSIRHAIPVRVLEFLNFKATVQPSVGLGALGGTAKNDKNFEVYIPKLEFGERRYFAPVIVSEVPLVQFIQDLIWDPVLEYIPTTYMDGIFDTPFPVADVRHQDTVIAFVQDTILDRKIPQLQEDDEPEVPESTGLDKKKKDKSVKSNHNTQKQNLKQKFEISLTGNAILAGTGRIIPFELSGEPNAVMGEVMALLSSNNLPAYDDLPILFINVHNLFNIPVKEFKEKRILQLYARWTLGDKVHESELIPWRGTNKVNFNDCYTLPLPLNLASELTASFLEEPFRIDIRAKLHSKVQETKAKFFGFDKMDRNFGKIFPPEIHENDEVIIANTKIDCKQLAKGINGFIRGEYFLFPPQVSVKGVERDAMSTNDINCIRMPLEPKIVISAGVILESNMSLEVSLGIVGCKPKKLADSLSRLYCFVYDTELMMALLKKISEINDEIFPSGDTSLMLTGFALDVGDMVFLYVEGPKDGKILIIWEMTDEEPSKVHPLFSSSARYSTRLYPDFISAMPFITLKMYAPLGVLLACPPVYARPTLPLPAKAALLKIGRIVSNRLREVPPRSEMPTTTELCSFRLELCVPPRPTSLRLSCDLIAANKKNALSEEALPKTASNLKSINFNQKDEA